ncbi:zinc finger protein 692 isoform X1 [Alligator mississippiensis]|uniref:Zinc finger protein 692 isoform C n=2 Tax=Alligator mississippiensis TaxID=8496 RepID=A0A151LYG9_ALLMI|nr:zinc finger protein 692 isoform X1 [Alligator mississippiensis]KYO17315.1 zinc finger protein 692 isoform C [Alligator mississippiensis]
MGAEPDGGLGPVGRTRNPGLSPGCPGSFGLLGRRMEQGRQGRQRVPECVRKQKRKELDARRSKCRIRIGGHLEQWCRLKEQLGFSLHSQLAKYLLDRYSSQGCALSAGQDESEHSLLHADALQRLVVLSHDHSQECRFIPDVKPASPGLKETPRNLVWECVAGHTFSWGPPPLDKEVCTPAEGGQQPQKANSQHREERSGSSGPSPPPSPIAGHRRSLRRAALAQDSSGTAHEEEPSPTRDGAKAERMETPRVTKERATRSSRQGSSLQAVLCEQEEEREEEEKRGTRHQILLWEAPQKEAEIGTDAAGSESPSALEEKPEQASDAQEEEEEDDDEDFTEEDDLAYTDDLRDENYHPSLDSDSELQRRQSQAKGRKRPGKEEQPPNKTSTANCSPTEEKGTRSSCKKRGQRSDEDVAQIGPKRIRKAAKREILLCDYEGCGKIFSNRQYLNHHKKYQHVHQKTFTCSEPSCGKSFNFKKHLKEHEKLHSDKRDYICEFCARSFRTSSNLIIHRRIHTGEKPLQCEICGFTCRQKASLNWHMKKHDADSFYQFSCDICGKKFEKKDNVTAHKSKSHPEAATGPPQPVTEASVSGHQDPPSPLPTFASGTAALENPDASCPLSTEQLDIPVLSRTEGVTLLGQCETEKAEGPVPPIVASAE